MTVPPESRLFNNHQSKSTTTIHFTPNPLKSSSSRGFMAMRNCSYTPKVQLHQSFVIRKAIDADTYLTRMRSRIAIVLTTST